VNIHKQQAVKVLILAISLDVCLGVGYAFASSIPVWQGLYYATGVATTSGNSPDVPHGWLPYVLSALMMLTVIPLFAASFSLITTGLTADHVDRRHHELKAHITATQNDGKSE
jgi:TRAP-type mannitol/chloroaromatic compound transport system permease large subunit